ncbi:RNA-directed DNA methylation 4, putative isoform 1 [Hibiscus syriacus]|uniref:RNA-directed DNA methylation 4, putative isoform 1 n=1 Tax=Hibiscus syriacus TaxID=106335 RepID=A0A6A2XYD4_HIBSY|nr:RNA-directed DNA methylation 4, putative isoform 1 [Hibiscus syriacus]
MCPTVFVYQPNVEFHVKPKDPASLQEEALSKLLVYYYPLAGKMKRESDRKLRITCNAAHDGVPFLVATANCKLSSLNHFDDIDVQTVAKPIEEIPQSIVDKDLSPASPYLPTTDIVRDQRESKALKMKLIKESKDESVISLEVLSAYIWRARFRALKLTPNGNTMLAMAVGIRRAVKPPLPEGYYGNAFTSANTAMTGQELDEEPLFKSVTRTKESKRVASDNGYIWNFMSINEKLREENRKFEAAAGSVNTIPLPWNMFGYVDLVHVLPPSKLDKSIEGGARVLVSLPRAALTKFKEEMEALKRGNKVAGH